MWCRYSEGSYSILRINYFKKDSLLFSKNRKLNESNTAQNGQQHKKCSEAASETGIFLTLLKIETPIVTNFEQRCRHEDCCAFWICMLTVHSSPVSSPASPKLKGIPNAHPVGPFAQYLQYMAYVVYSYVRCGFCTKFKNRKPSGLKRLYFWREAKKTRAHMIWLIAWTPIWRFMGGGVDSSYLYFTLLISICVTGCVKVVKKYMLQITIAENTV